MSIEKQKGNNNLYIFLCFLLSCSFTIFIFTQPKSMIRRVTNNNKIIVLINWEVLRMVNLNCIVIT